MSDQDPDFLNFTTIEITLNIYLINEKKYLCYFFKRNGIYNNNFFEIHKKIFKTINDINFFFFFLYSKKTMKSSQKI